MPVSQSSPTRSQFTCSICGDGFEQKSRLERHMATSHPPQAPSAADVERALSGIHYPKTKEVEATEKPSKRGGRTAVKSSSVSAATIAKVLSGIDFPKSKDSLKKYAKDNISKAQVEDADAVLELIDDLPSREYTNMADVEKSISRVL